MPNAARRSLRRFAARPQSRRQHGAGRAGGRTAQDPAADSIPTGLSDFAGWLTRTLGPLAAGEQDRPRQSRRRLPGEIARRDRGDPARRLGQSRPRRRRVRPSRPHLGLRPGHPDRIGRIDITPAHIDRYMQLRQRRQAGAGLRRASRQLGAAGHLRGGLQARQRGALPPPEHRRDRPLAASRRAPRSMGTLIPTGLDAPVQARRRARNAAPMSACWSTSITCAASR